MTCQKNPKIAEAIYFLAEGVGAASRSHRSSFMTGQGIVIDGGATARLSTE